MRKPVRGCAALLFLVLSGVLSACAPSPAWPGAATATAIPTPLPAAETSTSVPALPTNTPPPTAGPFAGGFTTPTPGDVPTPIPAVATLTAPPKAWGFNAPPALKPSTQPRVDVPPEVSQNPFLTLFPELRTAPAPGWLKEAARITYRAQSATTAPTPTARGSSGAGYVQYDLVAWDHDILAAAYEYLLDAGDGTLTPHLNGYTLGLPGVGDFWVSPSVLPSAERVASRDLVVVRMPAQVEGKTYHAVRFQYTSGKAQYVWMFEEQTGLLIFYSSSLGAEDDPQRELTQVSLVQQRQVQIPWQAAAVPAWVKPGATLRLEGTRAGTNYGSPLPEQPLSLRIQVQSSETRWNKFQTTDVTGGQANVITAGVNGVSQLWGSYWLPPEAIAVIQDGRILDRDPVTGAQVTAARSGSMVTLTEKGQTFRTDLTYDASDGVLAAWSQDLQLAGTMLTTRLRLVSRQ